MNDMLLFHPNHLTLSRWGFEKPAKFSPMNILITLFQHRKFDIWCWLLKLLTIIKKHLQREEARKCKTKLSPSSFLRWLKVHDFEYFILEKAAHTMQLTCEIERESLLTVEERKHDEFRFYTLLCSAKIVWQTSENPQTIVSRELLMLNRNVYEKVESGSKSELGRSHFHVKKYFSIKPSRIRDMFVQRWQFFPSLSLISPKLACFTDIVVEACVSIS